MESKNLHKCAHSADGKAVVKATGGGAYKFSKVRLLCRGKTRTPPAVSPCAEFPALSPLR